MLIVVLSCAVVSDTTKSKRDVVELVKSMNIQFDNLCQVGSTAFRHHIRLMVDNTCKRL
jgi:hypothetical protein